jgi:hypothetical protein
MLRIHLRLKYFRGMRVSSNQIIRIYISKYVKLWIRQRRKRHRNRLVYQIEHSMTQVMLINLMKKWSHKMHTIKSLMQKAWLYKISLYESILTKWNNAEYQEMKEGRSRRRRRTTFKTMKDFTEGVASIPNDVKLHYIQRQIRIRLRQYISEYRVYKAAFRKTHKQNRTNRYLLQNDIIVEYPVQPAKPDLLEFFSEEKIYEMICDAVRDKHEWKYIMNDENFKNKRSKRISKIGLV